jgi:hypothetical protein
MKRERGKKGQKRKEKENRLYFYGRKISDMKLLRDNRESI